MKNKIDQDQMAMLIADWEDGELTTCRDITCENCPLNKKVKVTSAYRFQTMCSILVEMSIRLSEVEYD